MYPAAVILAVIDVQEARGATSSRTRRIGRGEGGGGGHAVRRCVISSSCLVAYAVSETIRMGWKSETNNNGIVSRGNNPLGYVSNMLQNKLSADILLNEATSGVLNDTIKGANVIRKLGRTHPR